jgi:S-adenosylmethionine hydrolase
MKPLLVLQTDFSFKETAVSAMHGVIKSVDRELEIFDATHEIPQHDTWSASYRLIQAMPFWPSGTIFISVVDPGVGTPRKACVAKTRNGYYVVSPDNGSLTHLKHRVGILAVREIDERVNRLKGKNTENTSVFHGRDLFAYCGAKLASGLITYEEVGSSYPPEMIVTHHIHDPRFEEGEAYGIFEMDDPNFGNLWTNFPIEDFLEAGFQYGDCLKLTIDHNGKTVFSQRVPFDQSFGYTEMGDVIIYNNELMQVSVAINQGNFSEKFHIGYGPDWQVSITK